MTGEAGVPWIDTQEVSLPTHLGWSVGVGAPDEERREAAVEKLSAAGVDAFGVPLDVTDDASVAAAAGLVGERAGCLDVLVNNAGVTGGMPH